MAAQNRAEARNAGRGQSAALPANVMERGAAVAVADLFQVLADPTRVAIIQALSHAELCNSDLAAVLGISESAVSHQMHELRLKKLVSADKRGRMVYYRLTDTHIRHIFEDTLRHVQEDSHGANAK